MATEPLHAPARRGLPTSYAGHTFRSRLEARFAVLFDEMGIRWEYEPEGFELPSGLYVPDFWLADLSIWVEVKPDPDLAADHHTRSLALDLSDATGRPVLVSTGMDHYGIGEPVFRRFVGGDWDLAYLVDLPGGPRFVATPPEVGPMASRSWRLAQATTKAKAATFERPSSIPAYPLVVR